VTAILGIIFPFLLRFLGEGTIGTILEHRKEMAATATAAEKQRLDADVRHAEFELQRRAMQRDLMLKEMEHPWMWWPKFLIMLFVGLYWAARFFVKFTGLNDFNVAIAELSEPEAAVSLMVLGYMFLGARIERTIEKVTKK
jgi:hypothetical protein